VRAGPDLFGFQELGSRKVVVNFDEGMISSDAGGLLLREVEVATPWPESLLLAGGSGLPARIFRRLSRLGSWS
jgi:hypothetical protein